MVAVLLGLAAAFGTLTGLFLGIPAVGFLLWPLTRAVCRMVAIEIDPHDEHDPVMKLEGSLAAGLGMALGVLATVVVVGLTALVVAPEVSLLHVLRAGAGAGGVAGASFGALWRFGYRGRSVAPLLLATAIVAGLTAGAIAW
jgi:hypothetical protein